LSVVAINVPYEYRSVFESAAGSVKSGALAGPAPYAATIAYGRRFEPWLVTASRQ
jgi:hypothetical protein